MPIRIDKSTPSVARVVHGAPLDRLDARLRDETACTRERNRLARRTQRLAEASVVDARCVILGAGATGLAAALDLGDDALVIEREASVGGACRSIVDRGFTFDRAGHVIWSQDRYVSELYERLLADNVVWHDVVACMHDDGDVRADIAGDDDASPGTLAALIDAAWPDPRMRARAKAYQRKLWGVPPSDVVAASIGDDEHALESALSPPPQEGGPSARFGYPLRGGFHALMNGFLPLVRARVALRAEATRIDPDAHELHLADGRVVRYEAMVSTIPLPALVAMMADSVPDALRDGARALRHVSLRTVNIGVGRAHVSDMHWIHYPGATIFHRIFMQGNASPHNNAAGGFAITCEISHAPWKPLPATGRALIERCIDDCRRVGLLARDDPIWTAFEVDTPCAFVVCDRAREASVPLVRDWLAARDVVVAGRYGEWQQYGGDHAFVAARRACADVRATIGARICA